ncbi:MAG: hypothetical protein RBU30_12885 [Polyangia bacterium]|jgi:hypothetical protein|nr:hypothetical protein [Polyangia bacterium]
MRTHASHGTGKGRSIILLPSFLYLFFVAVVLPGCGDDTAGNPDAGGNPDAAQQSDAGIQDAYVDNGPLDCGVAPRDGALCVQGRLYDFATEAPIGMPFEGRIMSLRTSFGGPPATRDDPAAVRGRVVSSGRFAAWTNRDDDNCILLLDSFEGYSSAHTTLNCYAFMFWRRPEEPLRVYVPSDEALGSWETSYPGSLVFGSDWPLVVGVCRNSLWQPMQSGNFVLDWSGIEYGPHFERYALSADRMSIVQPSFWVGGEIPVGGATATLVELEETSGLVSMGLSCHTATESNNFDDITLGSNWVYQEHAEIHILNGFKSEE